MICAGSGRHAPQAIAGTAHKRPIGYCPRCRAHGPSPDDWADQVDDQRKRADAAEADLAAVDQALAELRDQISRQ